VIVCGFARPLAFDAGVNVTFSLQPIFQRFPVLSAARFVNLMCASSDTVHACPLCSDVLSFGHPLVSWVPFDLLRAEAHARRLQEFRANAVERLSVGECLDGSVHAER